MKGWHIEDFTPEQQRQIRSQLAPRPERRPDTIAQPHESVALGCQRQDTQGMVHSDRPLLVRITRIGGRHLDDDNLSGGCKELRDAIAAAFGRKGDSAKDGFRWEYRQVNRD